jgi:hypothetical protein
MHEGSTNVGVFDVQGKTYISMLFFRVDDRVEIFNEDEESIKLIFTADSAVMFDGKHIGRLRFPFPNETQTMKMVLFASLDHGEEKIIDSGIPHIAVEAFLRSELVFTKYLIENKIITVPAVV